MQTQKALAHIKAVASYAKDQGIMGALQRLRMTNEFQFGEVKGKDSFGNIYYENVSGETIDTKSRWVVYKDKDYTPTTVPPEWHNWLHHVVDTTPVEEAPAPILFKLNHRPHKNSSLGNQANYVPPGYYLRGTNALRGTGKNRYTAWNPKKPTPSVDDLLAE